MNSAIDGETLNLYNCIRLNNCGITAFYLERKNTMAAVTVKGLSGIKQTNSSLSEDLAGRIRDDILSGKLPNGSKLSCLREI